jgi:hypothetical protein
MKTMEVVGKQNLDLETPFCSCVVHNHPKKLQTFNKRSKVSMRFNARGFHDMFLFLFLSFLHFVMHRKSIQLIILPLARA